MVAINFNKGQALIETMISVASLVLILSTGINELVSAEKLAISDLTNARKLIWDYRFDDKSLRISSDYRMHDRLGGVLNPLDQLIEVDLPLNNLWETRKNIFPMVKLNDSWEAKQKDDLSNRPAKLVVNNALSGSITNAIQDSLSFLFISEELSSDSLKFGYINNEVVPENALKEECINGC
ncbi:MAG: hypothetical protein ACQEVQ_04485 [Pseudomonadota bacterium]